MSGSRSPRLLFITLPFIHPKKELLLILPKIIKFVIKKSFYKL